MSSNYIGFRLTDEMKKKLTELAINNHRSVSGQIRLLLESAIEQALTK